MINQLLRPILERLPENNRLERIWVLAKVDFLKRYYGSMLGLVWALINPIVQLTIFYFVFAVVLESKQPNFGLFLFLGLIIFLFFAEVSTKGLILLKAKRYILENIEINWLDIYYASVASASFAFIFNVTAYLIFSLFADTIIGTQIYLLPFLVLTLFMFALAVQIILSVIQIFIKDIVHVWDLTKMALMWLSGVFFLIDPAANQESAVLAFATPLAGIMMNARAILIYGEPVDFTIFLYDFAYALILLVFAYWFFYKLSRKALEKI